MPRRNEEPEWDTDEEEGESSGSESGFEDEEGSEDMSSEDGSGSEEESGSEDDESGSEEESGSEDESGSEEDSDGSDSEEDSDETTDRDEEMEDIEFFGDEEQKARSNGSLLNDPSDKPAWARFVPAKIMAMGAVAAAVCCCLIIMIPVLIIALSVGLTRGGDEKVEKVSPKQPANSVPVASPVSPTMAPLPTLAPTLEPRIKATTLNAKATNTIFREGIGVGASSGAEDTMLVQRGPVGDTELPSAYSLIQFEGITGIDNNVMSFDAYLDSVEGLEVEFCLNVASSENENKVTYTTCLLPSESTSLAIDELTGTTAPEYEIPDDCLNGKVVTFEVDSSTEKVCVDVASLLVTTSEGMNSSADGTEAAESTGETESIESTESESTEETESTESTEGDSEPNSSLRGRRRLEETSATGSKIATYLFMIDTLEESDLGGTRFYSTSDSEGRAPVLTIEGDNTCQSTAELVCDPESGFSKLCELVKKAGLVEALDTNMWTVFAPLDEAFEALSADTLEALNDVAVLMDVLQYHVVTDKVMLNDLNCNLSGEANQGPTIMANGGQTSTLCDDRGAVYQVGTGISPEVNSMPEIIAEDIETCFGVVHVIDQVLIPADTETNQTCISDDTSGVDIEEYCTEPDISLTTFCSMLTGINLDGIFSSGLYTIFAPTNDAFAQGFEDTFQDVKLATHILLQHVISGSAIEKVDENEFPCDQQIEMANGDSNTVTCREGVPYIGGPGNVPDTTPQILNADGIVGCNFVLHSIDNLILPEIDGITSESGDGEDPGGDDGGSGDDGEGYESCGICGGGLSITLPDATIEIPDSVGLPAENGDITCQMADNFCKSGSCSPDTCTAFSQGISASCGCEEGSSDSPSDVVDANNVVEVLQQNEETYSTLLSLAASAGLVETLQSEQDYTLFAPTEIAFDKLQDENRPLFRNLKKEEFAIHLTDVLLHHVLQQQKLTLSDITDQEAVAANGDTIKFRMNKNERRFVNENRIEDETVADNGIIHSISGVILPSWANQNILDVIGGKNDLFVVSGLMQQANLEDTLSGGGPFTIFAPINSAIEKELQNLQSLGLDGDSDAIAAILDYHVVEGIYPASSISDGLGLSTVQGGEIFFNVVGETATVNGFKITETDFLADNGIVHLIDGVMVPENFMSGAGGQPSANDAGAATQACSICTGSPGFFELKNPDAMLSFPDSITVPNIEAREGFCSLVEQTCQMGFCNADLCNALAQSGAKETCGCEEVRRS